MADITLDGKIIKRIITGKSGRESRFLTDFEEIQRLGSGGYGKVSMCKHSLDGKIYAIKKVPLNIENAEVDKFYREVILHSCLDHPNIVKYITSWIEAGFEGISSSSSDEDSDESENFPTLYIQLEYCTSTMKEALKETVANLKQENLVGYFSQILLAVEYMHNLDIVHRDLCPANILVKDNKIKLSDFGIAKKIGEGGECHLSEEEIGHQLYRAPEMKIGGQGIDTKSDIFSLGIILFEMLSDFNTEMERIHALEELKKTHKVSTSSTVPLCFQKLIMKMVSLQPQNRPRDIECVRSSVTRFAP